MRDYLYNIQSSYLSNIIHLCLARLSYSTHRTDQVKLLIFICDRNISRDRKQRSLWGIKRETIIIKRNTYTQGKGRKADGIEQRLDSLGKDPSNGRENRLSELKVFDPHSTLTNLEVLQPKIAANALTAGAAQELKENMKMRFSRPLVYTWTHGRFSVTGSKKHHRGQ